MKIKVLLVMPGKEVQTVKIPARTAVTFKAGSALKEAVNK